MKPKTLLGAFLLLALCIFISNYVLRAMKNKYSPTENVKIETETEAETEVPRIVYELDFDEASYYMLADGHLFPSNDTRDDDLFRSCYKPIAVWYDDTEILVSPKIKHNSTYNSFTYNNIIFLTKDKDFNFDKIKDLIVEKNDADTVVLTECCKLRNNAIDTLYSNLFPEYDATDVYS